MATVSVATLKAQLSAYLRMVKGGQEVLISERGRVVARIVPVDASTLQESRYEEMVAQGLVRPPVDPIDASTLPWPTTKDAEGRLLKAVLDERGDRR